MKSEINLIIKCDGHLWYGYLNVLKLNCVAFNAGTEIHFNHLLDSTNYIILIGGFLFKFIYNVQINFNF